MFPSRLYFLCKNIRFKNISNYCTSGGTENPVSRTYKLIKDDLSKVKNVFNPQERGSPLAEFPSYCDVVVIGGGAMGSSTAYWLKEKAQRGIRVVVVEQDPTYASASTVLSVGGLRQQFSVPENIKMSLFGADFLRHMKTYLRCDIDCQFNPHGYLILASEKGAEQLKINYEIQKEHGARNELLGKEKLKERFPWLNVNDIELGCFGLENEGWFDPWSLLSSLKKRAVELGTEYVNGKVVGFEFKSQGDVLSSGAEAYQNNLDKLVVELPNGERKVITFAMCVIAAGANSGQIASLAKIGKGDGMLCVPLPVEPRKRYVYCFECQENGPGLNTPLTIDHTGTYFRRDGLGGCYIGGRAPRPEEEPQVDNLDVDYTFFDTNVWPVLANRIPAFNAIKVRSAWSGFYEFNTFDENGIIGPHPYYSNLYIATGFSGHGIQQAPAVGRAVSELILEGGFVTIDLTRLGFDRIMLDKPIREQNCF